MKISYRLIFFAVLLVSCKTVHSQERARLDSIFRSNFAVLDSVASGLKLQKQLTHQQTAFLCLIDGWTSRKTPFDHYEGFKFGPENVNNWKKWYSKNSNKIQASDYYKSIEILNKLFTEGIVHETDLTYLDELDKKYSSL